MSDFKNENIWLMKGDCLERMKEIPDGSVDMVMTDPPYGTTACKWDSVINLDLMWKELKRIIKPNGAIVLTGSQPFTTVLVSSNITGFAHSWVWNKRFAANFVQAKRQPLKDHEDVLVFSKTGKQPSYYPIKVERDKPIRKGKNENESGAIPLVANETYKNKEYTHKLPTSTTLNFSIRTLSSEKLHPTQKPIELMEYLIKTYTQEGETVLDFTMGSGSTIKAAHNLGRKAIGIEMGKCEKKGHKYEGMHWVDVLVKQLNLK